MQNTTLSSKSGKPPIHLIDSEYDTIADLALGIERQAPALAKMLLDEIDRAEIHARDTLPGDVVSLGSEVEVLDEQTGAMRQLRLVLPTEANVETGSVSILTPMGAGLIGLRKGQSIDWPYPRGDSRSLKILNVSRPAA